MRHFGPGLSAERSREGLFVLLHLRRFNIVEDLMCVCVCAGDYETVDHLIWHCEGFRLERQRLIDALVAPHWDIFFIVNIGSFS
jgi:hypothetical protein